MNTDRQYDLAIIGGGITGAAAARDGAMRGLKVILIEQDDFGSGASSKTSKLAHGGLRYLENFEFGLVKSSMQERALLLKNAPHLVKPLPFIFPVFHGDPHPFWEVKLGMWVYDFLKQGKDTPNHKNLTAEQIFDQFPKIKHHKLKGGCLYYDAEMEDSRIVIENVLSAKQSGAHALNYTAVIELIKNEGRVAGVSIRQTNRETAHINAQIVVNASGAWSNQILDRDSPKSVIKAAPTKGAHLILPLINNDYALIMTTPQDGRVFFLIPWNGYSILGTTDTFFDGDPNKVHADEHDISYLLKAFHHYFPHLDIKKESIIASYAGLRPLISENAETASRVSRDHLIETSPSGLITVLGGKYTTHRQIAEEVVDVVIKHFGNKQRFKPCMTKNTPLYGGRLALKDMPSHSIKEEALDHGISEEHIKHLITRYGSAYKDILSIIKKNPFEGRQICELHLHLFAEITYSISVEMAKTLEDWYFRRTAIGYTQCKGLHCLQATAAKFAEIYNWDKQIVHNQMEEIEAISTNLEHSLDKVKH